MASSERTEGAVASSTAPAAGQSSPDAGATTAGTVISDPGLAKPKDRGESSGPEATASEIEAIAISCLTNAHYHASREAFLDTTHRWFMFGVIALGTAALVDIFPSEKKDWIKGFCSAGAAVLGALDLTFDLSNRARMHSMMRRRYFELLANVREGTKTPNEARVCIERFSGDEEPPYEVLFLACWNRAQESVYGNTAIKYKITRWGLATKNLFRRPGARYPV